MRTESRNSMTLRLPVLALLSLTLAGALAATEDGAPPLAPDPPPPAPEVSTPDDPAPWREELDDLRLVRVPRVAVARSSPERKAGPEPIGALAAHLPAAIDLALATGGEAGFLAAALVEALSAQGAAPGPPAGEGRVEAGENPKRWYGVCPIER